MSPKGGFIRKPHLASLFHTSAHRQCCVLVCRRRAMTRGWCGRRRVGPKCSPRNCGSQSCLSGLGYCRDCCAAPFFDFASGTVSDSSLMAILLLCFTAECVCGADAFQWMPVDVASLARAPCAPTSPAAPAPRSRACCTRTRSAGWLSTPRLVFQARVHAELQKNWRCARA